MTGYQWALLAWAGVGSLLWILAHVQGWRALMRLPSVGDRERDPPVRDAWPRVTLVVAACDEEGTIGAAAETLLALDYPELEIVIVDDRSTDRTGEIVDAIAARDPRVRAVHVTELPAGWLGKVHALARGVESATGEWLLFCDADIHLSPGSLRIAVDIAERNGFDHLPVLPTMVAPSFALEATICSFGVGYLMHVKADKLADPDSEEYAGVGAFNLVRAEALRRSEGLQWLRMEIADDVGIGLLIKQAGGRTGLALSGGSVRVLWYPSIAAMARGLEKNMFAVFGHYSVPLTLARLAAMWAVLLAPVAALALPWWTGAWGLTVASALAVALVARPMVTRLGQRFWPALAHPPAFVLLSYMVLRSTWRCWRRGGVEWKGRVYPLSELRAGQRVKV